MKFILSTICLAALLTATIAHGRNNDNLTNLAPIVCFGVFDNNESRPRSIVFPIVHLGNSKLLENKLMETIALIKAPARMVFETEPEKLADLVHERDTIIRDMPEKFRFRLKEAFNNAAIARKFGIPVELVELLPTRTFFEIASRECTNTLQASGRLSVEAAALRLAMDRGISLAFLESGAAVRQTIELTAPTGVLRSALSILESCELLQRAGENAVERIASGELPSKAQARYREILSRFGNEVATGSASTLRDLRLRKQLETVMLNERPGAIILLGADHLPDWLVHNKYLQRRQKVMRLCQ